MCCRFSIFTEQEEEQVQKQFQNKERLIMATTARATAAGAAALLYYTLNRKLQTQTTIDEDGDESGSNAPTDVQFCVTHRLIQAHATWFFRLLLFCGMKM
ncbi:Mono-/di-acylglycerol lipase, N-terminal-Lipase, class [Trifolium repens]|nr:Mono-/di-acylglycerol lipase, N-terminal-Lipase, class [Trifolium repens]